MVAEGGEGGGMGGEVGCGVMQCVLSCNIIMYCHM